MQWQYPSKISHICSNYSNITVTILIENLMVELYYQIPYSWKFSRDKNFEVFDLSSKIKTSKFGFKIIFIGERPCTSKIYSRKVGKR